MASLNFKEENDMSCSSEVNPLVKYLSPQNDKYKTRNCSLHEKLSLAVGPLKHLPFDFALMWIWTGNMSQYFASLKLAQPTSKAFFDSICISAWLAWILFLNPFLSINGRNVFIRHK